MEPQAFAQSDWLVQTKLQPPLPRADIIPRPRLLAALREAVVSCRLTLLSAPAGYGKTTLLASILHPRPPTLPVAWLTLDQGDNDPFLFLAYLTAALQNLNPACGAGAQAKIQSRESNIAAQRITGLLINDILETLPDPFVLILDDLHLVTAPTVHLALDYLLEHLPPQMHLAVGARHDPPLALARLRARGQLAELRLPDLRFTPGEAAAFLNDALCLALTHADLDALQSRTEGWPVGLRLLANSLDRIPNAADRAAFIAHLVHTDRHVFDFLADEVLNRQPPAVRAFLLETAILPELTVPLCNAVTGRTDAAAILEDLDRRSLFITLASAAQSPPAPSAHLPVRPPPTYRYHALFAEFLHQRLQRERPERVADLHRRAAQAQTNPGRAIDHYLAAQMWEEAVRAIEQAGATLFQQGLQDTLGGWVRALPPAVRETHPDLLGPLINGALFTGRFDEARSLLERLGQIHAAAGDEGAQGRVLAGLALTAFLQADLARVEGLVSRALAHPLSPHMLVQAQVIRAWLGLLRGDWAQVQADLEAALAVAQRSQAPLVWLTLTFIFRLPFAVLPGGLTQIEDLCHQATAFVEEPVSLLPLAIGELLAFVHLWRGRLAEAIQAGERVLALHRQMNGPAFLGVDAALAAPTTHAAQGQAAAADRLLAGLHPQVEAVPLLREAVRVPALYVQGRALWAQGRRDEARRVYRQMGAAAHPDEWPAAPALRLMLHGLLAMGGRRYAEAERSLREAASLERRTRLSTLYGSARLLLARLYLEWDRPQAALTELAPLLAEWEQAGTPGRILQEGAVAAPLLRLAVERGVHAAFAVPLLDRLGAPPPRSPARGRPRPVPVPGTGETLTPREVEVLRLIAAGASNRAIAEALVISERTVKSHAYNLFGKLGVANRTEAAARARDLHLV